mmetsp:Transcript_8134/g.9473  ORF Transcript_8134/g.9473 Transcript_8134/m.9473 type:complete len:161 (+) Transcript_8134:480-962(+)
MELNLSMPNPDDHLEWGLWTSPTDYVSTEFKHEFKSAIEALGERASFTPHMHIYDGLKAECRDSQGNNQCFNLCTNNEHYCAADPDNDLEFGISGADVVTESMRRLCIWKDSFVVCLCCCVWVRMNCTLYQLIINFCHTSLVVLVVTSFPPMLGRKKHDG